MRRASLLSLAVLLLACDKSGDTPAADPKAPDEAKAEETAAAVPARKTATPPPVTPANAPPAEVGKPAPDFTLPGLDGVEVKLSSFRGKTVVLEWFNPNCPFVNNAHAEGSLKTMAKDEVAKGVVWLAVNSGAPGKQGHGVEANTVGVKTFGLEHPVLLDESGAVGRAYGAEKTPHVFLIDGDGTLVYRGAIDNAPFGEVDGGGDVINYLANALTELSADKPITTPQTAPYGCTVKYGS
ncbi:MAG: thioredoxin family protein [Nannocystales bacterium]